MARRSPGQPKIPRQKPTASDRARRQRTRRQMQAESVDNATFQREKPSSSMQPDPLVTGHSGDVNQIGTSTTKKMSLEEYQKEVQVEGFNVTDGPAYYASEDETNDVANVQGIDMTEKMIRKFTMLNLADVFKTLDGALKPGEETQGFNISDEEYADDTLLNQSAEKLPDRESPNLSGTVPMKTPAETQAKPATLPKPVVKDPTVMTPIVEKTLEDAKAKITLAIETAKQSKNPAQQIEQMMAEIAEDTAMVMESTEDQLRYQVEALKFLCNAMVKNAKLAHKMTQIVNADQVTKAVNKALLIEDLNPVQLNLAQFLQHPLAAEVWILASNHNSDFVKDNTAWGHWWMGIIQDQQPRQRLRRTLQHMSMFNYLAKTTFCEFGQNPTKFTTEWLVIQLVRLGDHLLAANIKSEYGFNWGHAYQKVAAHIARNKMVQVSDIFAKLDGLWPAQVRMHFHYNQPPFNDCILQLSESSSDYGKIPAMKKMKHKHEDIFGGENVAARPDDDDDRDDDGATFSAMSQDHSGGESPIPKFPITKKRKRQPDPIQMDEDDDDIYSALEPRKPMSYADLFN